DGAFATGSLPIASSSSFEKDSRSTRWASQASRTVWKTPIGQPMHSILLRIITRMVAGQRRMISSTVMSGSIVSGLVTEHVSKEAHLNHLRRAKLCAGANSEQNAPATGGLAVRHLSACPVTGGNVKMAFQIPLFV